jgi:hypothetical protein
MARRCERLQPGVMALRHSWHHVTALNSMAQRSLYLLRSWCILVQPGTISWRGAAADHSILLVRPGHLPGTEHHSAAWHLAWGSAHPKLGHPGTTSRV